MVTKRTRRMPLRDARGHWRYVLAAWDGWRWREIKTPAEWPGLVGQAG